MRVMGFMVQCVSTLGNVSQAVAECGSHTIWNVLQSVLEGIEAPPHTNAKKEEAQLSDPFDIAVRGGKRLPGQSHVGNVEILEQWVREMVLLYMSRSTAIRVALLSGDAGCGMSYAIFMLIDTLRRMNVSIILAANNLAEMCSSDRKMMGFTKELLNML
ncbi:hypothetical protein XENOCAPTIV_023983 [Xenoophorus captivus]|uniref:Uncharacterized protein n=1 Tax=Xenoophorus captivus TaxID=1517983 RepID=A0ABV0QJT4_9TELE